MKTFTRVVYEFEDTDPRLSKVARRLADGFLPKGARVVEPDAPGGDGQDTRRPPPVPSKGTD